MPASKRFNKQQAPLAAQIQQSEQERAQASAQLAALSEENARLKSGRSESEVLKLRGQVGALRQQAASNETKPSECPGGIAKLMDDPATKEFMRKAMADKVKSLYADFIKERKLTPEQSEQFVQLLCDAGSKSLTQLTAAARGASNQAGAGASQQVGQQLQALLGDAGCARFKEFSDEMPARATLTLLNDQLGATPLSDQENASLIQIIKAEPADLTRGMLGGPDQAFAGSQADIDDFPATGGAEQPAHFAASRQSSQPEPIGSARQRIDQGHRGAKNPGHRVLPEALSAGAWLWKPAKGRRARHEGTWLWQSAGHRRLAGLGILRLPRQASPSLLNQDQAPRGMTECRLEDNGMRMRVNGEAVTLSVLPARD